MKPTDGPKRGVRAYDMDAVEEAISLLREAGFSVEGVEDAYHSGSGVTFTLELYKNTRSNPIGGEDENDDRLPAVMVALRDGEDPEELANELQERDGVHAVKYAVSGLSRSEVEGDL